MVDRLATLVPEERAAAASLFRIDRITAAYGAAHFGKSLIWYVSELFFAFYLTEVAGLDPRLMSVVIGLGLVTSAGIDLVLGWRFGQFIRDARGAARLQAVGAAASAVTLLLVFVVDHLPVAWRFGYALSAGLVFRIAYAVLDIPQNALLSLRDWPGLGRGGVSAIRLTGSGLAMLVVSSVTGVVFASRFDPVGARLPATIVCFSAVAVVSALGLRLAVREGERLPAAAPSMAAARVDWRALAPPIMLVFASSAAFSTFTRLEPYFGAHLLRSAEWGARIAAAFSVGTMLLQPLWAWLYARFSRRRMLAILACGLFAVSAAFVGLASSSRLAALVLGAIFGALNGGFGLFLWSWFADVVARAASGREGLAFAAFTASSKLALAIGGFTVGLMLAVIEYRGRQAGLLPFAMTIGAFLSAAACGAALVRRRPAEPAI